MVKNSLWSLIFFLPSVWHVLCHHVHKFHIPDKKSSFGRRLDISNWAGCLQLLLPQPQIVTISLKTARKQSPNTLVVFDVPKTFVFFSCSDTASFITAAANGTLATCTPSRQQALMTAIPMQRLQRGSGRVQATYLPLLWSLISLGRIRIVRRPLRRQQTRDLAWNVTAWTPCYRFNIIQSHVLCNVYFIVRIWTSGLFQ